ncbi:hypothetical protein HELRODRAFT_171318 [Helobdella robusta]|uniref:Uncharacterized protein n=1 Tax=Helobdella robusta TaxID=6412 RepID=T1F437_HELRO|nr:hypothetical protein HELRODRAFT_171318 [Helobdella robusta]ESO05660.1 hypothetical protein HELRODRAFT_171318 [Helobdella robusta]
MRPTEFRISKTLYIYLPVESSDECQKSWKHQIAPWYIKNCQRMKVWGHKICVLPERVQMTAEKIGQELVRIGREVTAIEDIRMLKLVEAAFVQRENNKLKKTQEAWLHAFNMDTYIRLEVMRAPERWKAFQCTSALHLLMCI